MFWERGVFSLVRLRGNREREFKLNSCAITFLTVNSVNKGRLGQSYTDHVSPTVIRPLPRSRVLTLPELSQTSRVIRSLKVSDDGAL
jgi:hypothetical protein